MHMTQPLGHSSSGSHERYKSEQRMAFERDFDCLRRMRAWLVARGYAGDEALTALEREERERVAAARLDAWRAYQAPIRAAADRLRAILPDLPKAADDELVLRRDVLDAARAARVASRGERAGRADALAAFVAEEEPALRRRYGSHLYSETARSPLRTAAVAARYADNAPLVDGRVVLRDCFDRWLARDPSGVILGEDVGLLGDVNLVYEGLQARHGARRVIDTGIREATILGQGIGLAQRGFRPIVDIQYLDYLFYALQQATDELATLRHRTAGGQAAPVVIRTKGHRLQGIWHAGSPMGTLVHALRGMHIAVPRDMTTAAGMYNLLLPGDDPALVVETLNAYRVKERLPTNLGDFTVPLGVPEVLRPGSDLTLVTYGACCAVALEAAEVLARLDVSAEVIDARTLSPFDRHGIAAASVRRTGALLVLDEDVPGGASAYLVWAIVDRDGTFDTLDVPPRSVTGAEHRTTYGRDGDYAGKPQVYDVVEAAYALMRQRAPERYPALPGR